MRERRLLPHIGIGLTLAMALACREPTAPTKVVGTYAMSRVAGDPLPAEVFATADVRLVALADTLRFRADGTGSQTMIRAIEDRLTGAPPTGPWRHDRDFHYRLIGARVEITVDCPIDAMCALVAGPHLIGDLAEGGLRVTYTGGQRVPQDYTIGGPTP